ncbi:MAG: ADP-ribosylglycohydrolase family protein [Clostridiales bacterium]|nr:ADP-ribosylglycohydrolase family protein [Clostridiales bacterium]
MSYISYREVIGKLQMLQEYSNLLTDYNCDERQLSDFRDTVSKQISAVQKHMDDLLLHSADSNEPDDYNAIVSLIQGGNEKQPAENLIPKIKGALIGRFAGCTLGTPVENWSVENMQKKAEYEGGSFPPTDYWKTVGEPWRTHYGETWLTAQRDLMCGVPRDDDVTYTLMSLLIMERYGKSFTTDDVGAFWKEYLPMACTAEEMALDNLRKGVPAKQAAVHNNPYANLIGALIRADGFGYANAGDPHAAAKAAYNDAFLTHRRDGIYGEMLFAAAIAAAFTCDDGVEAVKTGMREIPLTSKLYEAMQWTLSVLPGIGDIYTGRKLVDEKFPGMHCVHTINNACLILIALHLGQNDVGKTISAAIGLGLDNDCTAATAGSIAGAIAGEEKIQPHWSAPFNDRVRTYINGYPEFSIDDVARRFAKLNKLR